eukprot:3726391-Amphidinium_carterae.1
MSVPQQRIGVKGRTKQQKRQVCIRWSALLGWEAPLNKSVFSRVTTWEHAQCKSGRAMRAWTNASRPTTLKRATHGHGWLAEELKYAEGAHVPNGVRAPPDVRLNLPPIRDDG